MGRLASVVGGWPAFAAVLERTISMSAFITEQYAVPSDSNPGHRYTVSQHSDGQFSCDCPGWKFHTPRRDCKHIAVARAGAAAVLDPLLQLVVKARHKEARRVERLAGVVKAAA